MPAAAVASFTPAIGGISGNCAGASGETAVAMARHPRHEASFSSQGVVSTQASRAGAQSGSEFFTPRPSCELRRLFGRGRLVDALDLGSLAKLVHILRLR